jgi:DNA adenine methylase
MVASRIAESRAPGAPFLKWAGGKTQLLPEILRRLPARIRTYREPFTGGGAVFFALAELGRFDRAVLSDRNADLVEVYLAVRDRPGALIGRLGEHARQETDEDYFYQVRALDKATLSPLDRAARLLFLNRTCYNGLYRVNRRGQFNVPFGRYKTPNVCNVAALEAASGALQGVEILHLDFEASAAQAAPGDAIYFDPPYHPVSATSNFTAYDALPFGPEEHRRLARVLTSAAERGVAVVLSNSDAPFTRGLYPGFEISTVFATRPINSVAKKRGPVSEILVAARPRSTLRG